MPLDKNIIKRSFSEASLTYDSCSGLQREVSDELAERLRDLTARKEFACAAYAPGLEVPAGTENLILDIGCGTGRLIDSLGKSFPGAAVIGCDIALPMIFKARENLRERALNLAASDCESLPFRDSTFDIALSSLTFQWTDIRGSLSEAKRVLKPGGLFIFSTLGPLTLSELRECLGTPAPAEFRSAEEISAELKRTGFEEITIESRPVVKKYANLRGLIRTLKNIGAAPPASNCNEGLSKGTALRRAEVDYSKRFPSPDKSGIVATYEIIFASGRKGI